MPGKKKKSNKKSSKNSKPTNNRLKAFIDTEKDDLIISSDDLDFLKKMDSEVLQIRIQHSKIREVLKAYEVKEAEILKLLGEKLKEMQESSNTIAKKYVGDKIEDWHLDLGTGKLTLKEA
jgi:hypothetical protein